jgi:DNA invertase Pin-like site-specific DNA recombinase
MKIIAYLWGDLGLALSSDRTLWGWDVDGVYQDVAISDTTRPQWHQLLSDCATEAIDYLLVRRLAELGNTAEMVNDRVAQLEALGIRLIVLEQPDERTDMLKFVQELHRHQRSQRIRQGHARNRVKGEPPPGRAPYGYRRSKHRYVIDRTTAPIVKEFFDHFLLYASLRGAVRHIEKRYGKKIAASTGQRWLTNPVYRGDLAYQNGDVVADTHVAILSRDEAAQIDRLLRRNRRLPSRTASAPRSLAGLVICGECQSPMTITQVAPAKITRKRSTTPKEYLYLRPTRCAQQPKCKAIPYADILNSTIGQICHYLPQAVSGIPMPDLEGVKQGMKDAIAAKQAILAQLPDLLASGILDQETVDLRAYHLRTEMAQLSGKIDQLPPVNLLAIAQTVSIPQFWLDLSETERRFYLREFIRQIEIVRHPEGWQLKLNFIF